MKSTLGVCALCHEKKKLSLSHVIPEFLYQEMYDAKHRFQVRSVRSPNRKWLRQKGLREHLLCEDCESMLSVFEGYASRMFSGHIPVQTLRNGNLIEVRGLDYKQFRLFGLSILWRAGVASDTFYKAVSLGPHEPHICRMIVSEDPGEPNEYGFFLSPLVMGSRGVTDLMLEPTRSRLDNHLCYRFVFGGLVWVFVVSSHSPPRAFKEAFVNRNGKMLMLVSDLQDVAFIRDAMDKALQIEN